MKKKPGRPKKDDPLERTPLTIRVHRTDLARLDRVAATVPDASRNWVARRALQLGLALLEADPTKFVERKTAEPKARGK